MQKAEADNDAAAMAVAEARLDRAEKEWDAAKQRVAEANRASI
jgi:hypothetical protein